MAVMLKSVMVIDAAVLWEKVPLAPVTVMMNVPAVVELHETVAVPEPVTVEGLIVLQLSPAGTESVRLTVPVKPFRALTVTVD